MADSPVEMEKIPEVEKILKSIKSELIYIFRTIEKNNEDFLDNLYPSIKLMENTVLMMGHIRSWKKAENNDRLLFARQNMEEFEKVYSKIKIIVDYIGAQRVIILKLLEQLEKLI